ncbi:MAG: Uma2 family endonuclease [Verrucomicrobia bacterium]|nr:Uma2 family endonuclease [Verrucomicrobiota bacterium]
MSTALAEVLDRRMSVHEYRLTEEQSEVKREYLAGYVYAMAGASEAHNLIVMNLYAMLHSRLRGQLCRAFGSDMQVRLQQPGGTYFYYPDAMIACDSTDVGHGWRERPAALFEIVSESTRRTDEREKRMAYLSLGSLVAYVRIEQDRPAVFVEARTNDGGWEITEFYGLEAVAKLTGNLGMIALPLAELYEHVSFPASRNGASAA